MGRFYKKGTKNYIKILMETVFLLFFFFFGFLIISPIIPTKDNVPYVDKIISFAQKNKTNGIVVAIILMILIFRLITKTNKKNNIVIQDNGILQENNLFQKSSIEEITLTEEVRRSGGKHEKFIKFYVYTFKTVSKVDYCFETTNIREAIEIYNKLQNYKFRPVQGLNLSQLQEPLAEQEQYQNFVIHFKGSIIGKIIITFIVLAIILPVILPLIFVVLTTIFWQK